MNKRVIIFLTIVIVSETSECVNMTTTKMLQVDLFSNLNMQLHRLSGVIFRSLKLGRNFTSANKINVLVKMADDLIKLSERKFKMYKDVHNVTKIGIDNKTINSLFNLTRVIEEIFKEEHYFLRNNMFLKNNSLIDFYEALVSDSNWLEKSVIDWENADNRTDIRYRRKVSAKAFRRKYQNKINALISRRRMDDLRPWKAPNESESLTRRVFGSEPANIRKYPFVASLLLMNEFVCAASIISKDMVLTAASCLQLAYQNPGFMDKRDAIAVRVGSDYTDKGGEVEPITEVYFHSKYDPVYLYNNLAIGMLEKSLKFLKSNKKFRRIEYDRDRREMVDKTGIIILGWGDQTNYKTYSGPLTMAHLETYNWETCRKIYSAEYVSKSDFCAGFVDQGTGACHRDVGGPGFIGSQLVGVVNFGPPVCGTPNGPTVFTKIGNFAPWIDSIIAKSISESNKTQNPHRPVESQKKKSQHNKARNVEKKSVIQKSALDLLRTLFEDLGLNVLLNNKLFKKGDFDNQPDDDSIFETTTKLENLYDWNDVINPDNNKEFFESTTILNDLVNKILYTKALTTNDVTTVKVTAGRDNRNPELGELFTMPHNTDDIDPEIVDQLKQIKDILEPIFGTTNTPQILKTRRLRTPTTTSKEIETMDPTMTPAFLNQNKFKLTPSFIDTDVQEIIDNESDQKDIYDYSAPDKLSTNHEITNKNWDESTEEEIIKLDSNELTKKSYEERRMTTTPYQKAKKKRKERFFKTQKSFSEINSQDFKLRSSTYSMNETGSNLRAVIISEVNNNVRNRDTAHYQESEEVNLDDEPTRRLLDYVNI